MSKESAVPFSEYYNNSDRFDQYGHRIPKRQRRLNAVSRYVQDTKSPLQFPDDISQSIEGTNYSGIDYIRDLVRSGYTINGHTYVSDNPSGKLLGRRKTRRIMSTEDFWRNVIASQYYNKRQSDGNETDVTDRSVRDSNRSAETVRTAGQQSVPVSVTPVLGAKNATQVTTATNTPRTEGVTIITAGNAPVQNEETTTVQNNNSEFPIVHEFDASTTLTHRPKHAGQEVMEYISKQFPSLSKQIIGFTNNLAAQPVEEQPVVSIENQPTTPPVVPVTSRLDLSALQQALDAAARYNDAVDVAPEQGAVEVAQEPQIEQPATIIREPMIKTDGAENIPLFDGTPASEIPGIYDQYLNGDFVKGRFHYYTPEAPTYIAHDNPEMLDDFQSEKDLWKQLLEANIIRNLNTMKFRAAFNEARRRGFAAFTWTNPKTGETNIYHTIDKSDLTLPGEHDQIGQTPDKTLVNWLTTLNKNSKISNGIQ